MNSPLRHGWIACGRDGLHFFADRPLSAGASVRYVSGPKGTGPGGLRVFEQPLRAVTDIDDTLWRVTFTGHFEHGLATVEQIDVGEPVDIDAAAQIADPQLGAARLSCARQLIDAIGGLTAGRLRLADTTDDEYRRAVEAAGGDERAVKDSVVHAMQAAGEALERLGFGSPYQAGVTIGLVRDCERAARRVSDQLFTIGQDRHSDSPYRRMKTGLNSAAHSAALGVLSAGLIDGEQTDLLLCDIERLAGLQPQRPA